MLDKMHHVAIICSDYRKARAFYVDILGFEVVRESFREDRGDCMIDLRFGDAEIELFIKPGSPSRPSYPEACGLRHLAFRVDDVEACLRALADKGVRTEPLRTDDLTGQRMAFFYDPDMLPLELHE